MKVDGRVEFRGQIVAEGSWQISVRPGSQWRARLSGLEEPPAGVEPVFEAILSEGQKLHLVFWVEGSAPLEATLSEMGGKKTGFYIEVEGHNWPPAVIE